MPGLALTLVQDKTKQVSVQRRSLTPNILVTATQCHILPLTLSIKIKDKLFKNNQYDLPRLFQRGYILQLHKQHTLSSILA